ncbi:MAG TPA: hypothetical protein VMT16_13935 [Thermoanaerobaculia bacterium]|nr:hypothetical protein [Thermoanaerobaculia bacterium]
MPNGKAGRAVWGRLPALLAVTLVAFPGCRQTSEEERIADVRSQYQARLNGWIVREEAPAAEMPAPEMEEDGEGMAGQPEEGAAAEAEAGEEVAPGITITSEPMAPERRDVILDIVLFHTAPEALPGITLDISQAGPDEAEKAHFRAWIDTSEIRRGQHAQVNYVLEDLDFFPGDVFAVEVRDPVPPEERHQYREFASGS